MPFQNNTNPNVGPFNRTQNVLNIEPVVPMSLNAQWNVISRTIVPVMSQPNPLIDSSTNGVGDISESLFLSPVNSGIKDFYWGFGPIITAPSASDAILGTGKVLLGPTFVVVAEPGHWVIGLLVNNQWSVAGAPGRPSVNFLTAQYFINYNIPGGHVVLDQFTDRYCGLDGAGASGGDALPTTLLSAEFSKAKLGVLRTISRAKTLRAIESDISGNQRR